MPTSGPMTERSFKVSAIARREWSESDRQRIVQEALVPGANVSAVARRNGVAQSLLYRWRKERVEARTKTDAPTFVPVRLLAGPQNDGQNLVPPQIEIVLPDGTAVRCSGDMDAVAIGGIVAILKSAP